MDVAGSVRRMILARRFLVINWRGFQAIGVFVRRSVTHLEDDCNSPDLKFSSRHSVDRDGDALLSMQ